MAKAGSKSAKAGPSAIPVAFKTLTALLGKTVDDPAVVAMLAKAGKVTVKPDFVIAKEAGFDISLDRWTGGTKKLLTTLFLFAASSDGHRGYAGLPKGFAFAARPELVASLPAPKHTWLEGKGKVAVAPPGAEVVHDMWKLDGFEIQANYRDGVVEHFTVSLPEEAMGGRDLSTHPLHFETKPADAPPEAALVGMALLVAWAAERFGLPAKHAKSELGKQLLARKVTPRTFLIEACSKRLSTLDFDPKLGDFLYEYEHHLADDEARREADAEISKLLGLRTPSSRNYDHDFLGAFAAVMENPFHIPDSWDAVDRIAPVLDARLADYQATSYETPPDLALYRKAVKLRDARSVTPTRATIGRATVDAALATDLVALIDRSLKDKHVKEVLTRAGMPIGKVIDQQANPALGVAYMGVKFTIDGKHQLGVDGVWFYADKQEASIRGLGGTVQFVGYPGPLPLGLAFGEMRASVAAKLGGAPKETYKDHDTWYPTADRAISCSFEDDKLVRIKFGKPRSY